MTTQAVFNKESKAGMQIKIVQKIVDKLKNDLLQYLPYYINYDLELPKRIDTPMDLFGWRMNSLHITNIFYDLIYMDLKMFKFEFTQYEYVPVIWITFPFLEGWRLTADWNFDWGIPWLMPQDGKLVFTINDVGLNTAFSMKAEQDGTIQP